MELAIEILTKMKLQRYIENKKKNRKRIAKINEENLYDFCIKLLKEIMKVEEMEYEKVIKK